MSNNGKKTNEGKQHSTEVIEMGSKNIQVNSSDLDGVV